MESTDPSELFTRKMMTAFWPQAINHFNLQKQNIVVIMLNSVTDLRNAFLIILSDF